MVRRHWGLFLALALATAILLPFSVVELGRDQANWLTVAMALENGSVMYRDVAVVNTPGLGVLFVAVNALFGDPPLTPWIVHLAAVLATITAGYLWAYHALGRAAAMGAALLCAVLWPQTMDWWNIAQKDGVTFAFALMGLAFLAIAPPRRGWAIGAGALMAAAVLTKTTGVLYALPLGVQLYFSSGSTRQFVVRALWCVAGGLAVLALAAAYLTWHSAWQAAYMSLFGRASAYGGFARYSVAVMLVRLSILLGRALGFTLLLPVLSLGAGIRNAARVLPLGLMVVVAVLGFVLQGRGWTYHSVPVTASVALALGAGLGLLLANASRMRSVMALVLVVLSLTASWARYGERWVPYAKRLAGIVPQEAIDPMFDAPDFAGPAESREVAAWIRQATEPTDRIFVWGMESQLYVYSNRMFVGPSFADAPIWHPQLAPRNPAYFQTQRANFFAALTRTPPAVFVVARNDANPVEPWASDRSLRSLPEIVEFIDSNYTLEKTTDHFLVYRHR
ncbi:hypothetical protein Ga0609869_001711 [Rhodovulum iodosum]|uniref:Glycosyltransferase RgtA/B/C/D-like domain-containing protein n=1 Tax=Rhodovulum iodosum TaxID=68291 RepID=A0ABV3XSR6_9RHOB|nr:glycosyltransferase family 39 protein [Rhodovulum robiginosum]